MRTAILSMTAENLLDDFVEGKSSGWLQVQSRDMLLMSVCRDMVLVDPKGVALVKVNRPQTTHLISSHLISCHLIPDRIAFPYTRTSQAPQTAPKTQRQQCTRVRYAAAPKSCATIVTAENTPFPVGTLLYYHTTAVLRAERTAQPRGFFCFFRFCGRHGGTLAKKNNRNVPICHQRPYRRQTNFRRALGEFLAAATRSSCAQLAQLTATQI